MQTGSSPVATRISWWDTLLLQFFVSFPSFLLGLVAPNRFFVSLLSGLAGGRFTLRFLSSLRERYQSDHLWVWFPGGKTLLVLNPETIDAVLLSEDNAADPKLKKRALSRFVPDALVISSGEEWRDRRTFNESALCFGKTHVHADAFKEIVVREVEQLTSQHPAELRWHDFEKLGERVSRGVILGAAEESPEMTAQLARMVRYSNVLSRHGPSFAAFYERIDRYLAGNRETGATACLMHDSAALIAKGATTPSTRVPAQIGFWLFVLKDAVELHVARTLALIAAHPQVQARVRQEVANAGPLNTDSIAGLQYLDACIAEQLRLWTPVPILLRRALRPFSLRNEIPIGREEQILVHAGFYHRDPRVFHERADRFSPDALAGPHPTTYFFSRHRQSCAGRSLVTFVLKATLASLLGRFQYELISPVLQPAEIPYIYDHFKIALRPLPDA